MEVSNSNQRLITNTIYLYGRMILILFISVYTTRLVLKALGVVDFGIYNVVCGFVSIFSFLTVSLSNAIQRFYNYEKGKKQNSIVRVFNTALVMQIFLAIVVLVFVEPVGVWYINNVMVIPPERILTANFIFQFSIVSLVLVVLQAPFSAAVIAYEKMGYFAVVSLIDAILKLILVCVLIVVSGDKLLLYGIIILLISILNFLAYFLYVRIILNEISINFSWDKKLLKSMLSFSGWNIVETLAHTLKGQGVNVILNLFFGPVINTANGIATQTGDYLKGFSQNVITAFRPQLVQSYAQGNNSRVKKMMFSMSKFSYAMMLALVIPIIVEVNYILAIWLGESSVTDYMPAFVILCLIFTTISTLNPPLTQVVHATGSLRKYQLTCAVIVGLIVPLSWLSLKLGFSPLYVYFVTILMTIVNQIASVIILNKIFPFNILDYIRAVVFPCLIMSLLCPLPSFAIKYCMAPSLFRLALVTLTSLIVCFFVFYFFVINKDEREMLRSYLYSKLKRS